MTTSANVHRTDHLDECATDDGPSTDVYDADADVVGEEPVEEPVEERADKAAG